MSESEGQVPNVIVAPTTLREILGRCERHWIAVALEVNNRNITHTASALGIARRTLHEKIKTMKLTTRLAIRIAAAERPL